MYNADFYTSGCIPKYICLNCKKVFKRKPSNEELIFSKDATCPECSTESVIVGPKFRAPKKTEM